MDRGADVYRGEEKCEKCGHRRDHHNEGSGLCTHLGKDADGRDVRDCDCKKFIPSGKA